MADFKLPELGENIEKGTVVNVHIKPGDSIQKDQTVVEVETEKAVVEVPSPFAGKVSVVKVKTGDVVKPGQLIFSTGDGVATSASTSQTIQRDSRAAGIASAPAAKPAAAEPKPAPAARPAPAPAPEPEPEPAAAAVASGPAAPSVRKLAREIGVNIGEVPGSGPGGRISLEDVKAHAKRLLASRPAAGGAAGPRPGKALPDFSKWGAVERKAMSGIRRATAEQMEQAWTIPHVTHDEKTDVTELEDFRKKLSKQEGAPKLTVTAVALKIAAAALQKFPQFNASLDMASGEIVYKKYVNIGVAVDTDRGLLVPVIRDVDKKNLTQLSQELGALAEKARARKLSLDEMQGGTFTITNLGGVGGTRFSPIVNWPEVAILGMSRASLEPVFVNGAFAPRLMMPISLSYDHRIIDGADAARFLRWVAQAFQQPLLLSMGD
jgi:pyruvate dehydrogenase E2 component (dihydrolipoamide acetyltransferase)